MSTEKQARERMVQQRHNEEHVQDSMLSRSEAEVETSGAVDGVTQEQARELMTEQRHDKAHLQALMLNRAGEEVGINHAADSSSQ